jgi:exopolysaccharide production protein ExoQ
MSLSLDHSLDHRARFVALDLPAGLTLLALTALVLNPLFGSLAAYIFLLAGGLLFVSNVQHSTRSLLQYWFVMLLPAYCALSAFWSDYPPETFRAAIQLALTLGIAVMIATRLPPRLLVRCLFIVFFLAMVASAVFGRVRDDTGAWVGIFGSKNAFAAIVSVFILTCIAAAADRQASRLQFGMALFGMLIGLPILLLAQSAGATIVLLPSAAMLLLVLFGRRLSLAQRRFGIGALLVLLVVAGTLALGYGTQILDLVLSLSNKDATLTGRTDLWEVAGKIIARNPLWGVGYRAFWIQGNAPAEELWAQFGISTRSGFNFHNTYISNAVEIGYVGVVLEVIAVLAAIVGVFLWALRRPSADAGFFAAYLTTAICGSFVEVAIFFPFSLPSLLIVCALVYAIRARQP